MIVLLDENFPLGLVRGLRDDGVSAEHIITLGWRGVTDARIREWLQDAQVVFLTQDEDFLTGETARRRHRVPCQAVATLERSDRSLAQVCPRTACSFQARAIVRVDG